MISIKIKDPLFTCHAPLVNILDFNPKNLSIEKVCAINDELEHIYYVKYGGDPFYLIIDDLKGYFKYSKEKEKNTIKLSSLGRAEKLKFIIEDQRKRKIYNQIWDKIKELIDTLPLDAMVSVSSMTIIIGSVYKTCYDRLYPQIYLTNCIYKKC